MPSRSGVPSRKCARARECACGVAASTGCKDNQAKLWPVLFLTIAPMGSEKEDYNVGMAIINGVEDVVGDRFGA